jgi:hypothetical protein
MNCVVSTPALAGTRSVPICCHTTFNWSDGMKYLFVAMAVGAAALAGGTAANAANNSSAKQNAQGQSTDISAQHRHHHGHRQHWRPQHYHGYHRPHYRGYGYYPRHHGYYGGGPYGAYGRGGPGVTFSFGGSRW